MRGSILAFGILEGPDEQDLWWIRNEETGERFGFFSRSVDNFTTIDGLPAVVFPGSYLKSSAPILANGSTDMLTRLRGIPLREAIKVLATQRTHPAGAI